MSTESNLNLLGNSSLTAYHRFWVASRCRRNIETAPRRRRIAHRARLEGVKSKNGLIDILANVAGIDRPESLTGDAFGTFSVACTCVSFSRAASSPSDANPETLPPSLFGRMMVAPAVPAA